MKLEIRCDVYTFLSACQLLLYTAIPERKYFLLRLPMRIYIFHLFSCGLNIQSFHTSSSYYSRGVKGGKNTFTFTTTAYRVLIVQPHTLDS